MRIMTLARFKAAILLAAVLALVPQFAFAQLPVETRELKLQDASSGSLLLKTATSTTSYSLIYPGVQGTKGAFLYLASTDGTLAWSNDAGGDGYTPVWDGNSQSIKWENPAGAANPNWARTGNALTAGTTGILGTTTPSGMNVVTNGNLRMSINSDGVVAINTGASGGTTTNIGRVGHTTNVDGSFDVDGAVSINVDEATATDINTGTSSGKVTIGNTGNTVEQNASVWDINAATATIDATTSLGVTGTTNINTTGSSVTTIGNSGATNINTTGDGGVNIGTGSSSGTVTVGRTGGTLTTIGSLGHTGTATITGATTINSSGSAATTIGNTDGGTSFTGPIKMGAAAGTSGNVLVSKGANATPEWQNLTQSIGIRRVGVVEVVNVTVTAEIPVTDLVSTDAIIITLQTSLGSTVVGTVTDRSNQASGSFKVTFSGRFTGAVNYMVIKKL